MALIRGLLRITPAQPMQKRGKEPQAVADPTELGWQIVIRSFCFVLVFLLKTYRSLNKQEAQ